MPRKEREYRAESHDHYCQEVRERLYHWERDCMGMYLCHKVEFRERILLIERIQSSWDRLAKARKLHTGTGFYLNKEQYDAAVEKMLESGANQSTDGHASLGPADRAKGSGGDDNSVGAESGPQSRRPYRPMLQGLKLRS